jgi:hypothetical protein
MVDCQTETHIVIVVEISKRRSQLGKFRMTIPLVEAYVNSCWVNTLTWRVSTRTHMLVEHDLRNHRDVIRITCTAFAAGTHRPAARPAPGSP